MTRARYLMAMVALAVTYFAGAQLGLMQSLIAQNVTPLWPCTGIAVAAFLLWGRSLWPAVAVAALAVNLPISESPLAAVVTAAGNTLAPLLAVALLGAVGFRRQLDRQQDALALVFLGALPSTLVSSAIGALTLVVSGAIDVDQLSGAFAVWWTGDAMGVLTVAPFLLCLPLFRELPAWSWRRWLEALTILVLASALVTWAVLVEVQLLFLTLPMLGWASWRLQLRGAAPAALAVCLIATEAAAHSQGAFASAALPERMFTLQTFNACVALTSLILAALVSERNSAAEALATAALELEDRVTVRTAELSAANARLLAEIHDRAEAEEQLSQEEARSRRQQLIAYTLKRSLLLPRLPRIGDIAFAGRFVPATDDPAMGGDWYEVIELPNGLVGIAVGGVPGHGPDTAATTVQVRMALRAFATQRPAPEEVMIGVQQLVARLPVSQPVTMTYVLFDPTTATLRFSNAGNPPPLVIGGGVSRYLGNGTSPALNGSGDVRPLESSHQLSPGATLLLYSRGLVARPGEPDELGLDRLMLEATHHDGDDIEELCDQILSSLGSPDRDALDIALVAMRPLTSLDGPLELTLPAEHRMLVDARRALRQWLRDAGVPVADQKEILVACGEACTNVVRHAYQTPTGTMMLLAHIDQGVLELTVRDRGAWRPALQSHRGLGLQLINGLMDSVDIDRAPGGTVVTMHRTLGRTH